MLLLPPKKIQTISIVKSNKIFTPKNWSDVFGWYESELDYITLGDGVILRADGVTPTATDDIIAMTDLSGNGNHLSAIVNGIVPPKINLNDINFNGRPTIDNTLATQNRFECPTMNVNSNYYTFIFVVKPASIAANQDLFYSRNTLGSSGVLALYSNRTGTNQYAFASSSVNNLGGTPNIAPKIIEFEFDGIAGTCVLRVNNHVIAESSSYVAKAINTAIGILGRPSAGGGVERFNGYAQKIILAAGKMPDKIRRQLYGDYITPY